MSSVIPNPGAKPCPKGCGPMDAWRNNIVDGTNPVRLRWYLFQKCWQCGHKERERCSNSR